jgi:membrane-bound lytic murein transglycosylase A
MNRTRLAIMRFRMQLWRWLSTLGASALACVLAPALSRGETLKYHLEPASFGQLPGFVSDNLEDALKVFVKTCDKPVVAVAVVEKFDRAAQARVCAAARRGDGARNARKFFERHFLPFRVVTEGASDAFFTGYYQPEIPGSLEKSHAFPTPVYGIPRDLVVLSSSQRSGALADLTAARRNPDGVLTPYPDRGAIEDGALDNVEGVKKLVYLRDNVDLFLAQVQGSARVRLRDGRVLRLSFAARNGQPYTALARVLVTRGIGTPSEMTMRRLGTWMRQNGIERGQAGDDLLRLNRSFIFFTASLENGLASQPVGGCGEPLTPLRSIAVDAHIWPYGLPFFVDAMMPWRSLEIEPFQRVVIAQDTGSAIVGPARADVFFGLDEYAGERASEIRHHGQFYVLLPRN